MKTKFFAVVIMALLVLAILPVFSYQPSEETVLYIDPQKKKFTGPCTESQTFEGHVMIWNVEDLYAWDITITWDTTYINITEYHIKTLNFPVDGYQILIDDYTTGQLHFAVTRLGNVSGYDGSGVATSLLNFVVHIEYEPCWEPCGAGCITTYINIADYALSSDGKIPPDPIIPDDVENGKISINPSKPNMEVFFTDVWPGPPLSEAWNASKVAQGWFEDQVITAYVWVSNATKLYGIAANIIWNPDLLEIDLQQITINEEAFPQPWVNLEQCLTDGDFQFQVIRPTPLEKPPIKGTFWILKMDFKVKCVTNMWSIPIDAFTDIVLDPWSGLLMCGTWYDGYLGPDWIDLSDATYFWTPIPYDFSQNGHVGVEDIMTILDHYGDDYNTTITDDKSQFTIPPETLFGSRDNEAVAFSITSGLTLDELFAGKGLMYTFTVIDGGTSGGAAPVIAVIDLEDGRHIVLYPGYAARADGTTHTLKFSATKAWAGSDGGHVAVDFTIYPAGFIPAAAIYSSVTCGYGDFVAVNADTSLIDGTEVVTRIAIQHQAAGTFETDRVESMIICGTTYNFPFEGFDFDGDLDVDIFDIVIVAKHYCNDEPPEMPDDP